MRSKFDMQLEELKKEMTAMGMLCENAIAKTSQALLSCDTVMAAEMPELLNQVTQKERDIEGICLKLLLHQQPVARDLRTVSAALKMVTDAQRIGTQSTDISEIVVLGNIREIPKQLPIRQMADSVTAMVTSSIEAFVKQDGKIATSVVKYDDVVDGHFNAMKAALIDLLKEPSVNAEGIIDLLMIAKYYERIGDHAVNIAKWVLFSLTGRILSEEELFEEDPHISER